MLQLSGCDLFKKNDPKPLTELEKLPPATQTGKNTFGCLINGKAVVAPTTVDVVAIYQQGTLQISGGSDNPSKSLQLVVNEKNYGLLTTTSYLLNKYPDSFSYAHMEVSKNTYCTYDDQNALSGSVTLSKIDRTNYIISGTFEFVTVSTGCDTLKVTNGRFDIKYIPG